MHVITYVLSLRVCKKILRLLHRPNTNSALNITTKIIDRSLSIQTKEQGRLIKSAHLYEICMHCCRWAM